MNAYAGLIATALFAVLVFALPISVLLTLGYGRLQHRVGNIAAATRSRIYLGLAALPFTGALAGLLASFMPSLLSWAGVVADHCHLHPDHIHLCLHHPPQLAHTFLASMFVAAVVLVCSAMLGSWLLHWHNTRRLVNQLLAMSRHDVSRDVHIVDTDAPLALAAGLHAPQLFLSRLLVSQLTGDQLAVVIAHERAHAARHDALSQTIASALSRLHLPWIRKALLADLSLAAEQACDEAACSVAGDRLVVAETIVAVEKLFARQSPRQSPRLCATSHFNDSHVGRRVLAILDAPRLEQPSARAFWLAVWCALLVLVVLGEPLHHATESLLGLIFH